MEPRTTVLLDVLNPLLHLLKHDLTLKCQNKRSRFLPLPLFRLGKSARLMLLPRLLRDPCRAGARADRKSLARKLRLEDTSDNIQCPRLHHAAPDGLIALHTDVRDALERKREDVFIIIHSHQRPVMHIVYIYTSD
jgi:hypothetical protein